MEILCDGWDADGTMSLIIYTFKKISRYEYMVDAARIPGWKKRMIYQPGKVLNEIKQTATAMRRL